MAKLTLALLCQRILLDQPTNLVSYIDVLDGVAVSTFPATISQIILSSIWQRENESTLEMRVRVQDPDGAQLREAYASPLAFGTEHKRGRMNVGLLALEFAQPGKYQFVIDTRAGDQWVEAGRVPLDLDAVAPKE